MVEKQTAANIANDHHRHWTSFRAVDGHELDAFLVTPPSPRGSVVVLQEIFGVNPHMQRIAGQIARLGYTAVVPALFDRVQKKVSLAYDKAGIEQGKALIGSIPLDTAMTDTAAAVAHAAAAGPVAVLGFCWGGSLAWLAANRLPIAGAIAYYGGQIGSLLDQVPFRPVLTHFGETDASIPPDVAVAITQRLGTVINHTYPAGHGFNCDERGSFDAGCATHAWSRTAGFLAAVI